MVAMIVIILSKKAKAEQAAASETVTKELTRLGETQRAPLRRGFSFKIGG